MPKAEVIRITAVGLWYAHMICARPAGYITPPTRSRFMEYCEASAIQYVEGDSRRMQGIGNWGIAYALDEK